MRPSFIRASPPPCVPIQSVPSGSRNSARTLAVSRPSRVSQVRTIFPCSQRCSPPELPIQSVSAASLHDAGDVAVEGAARRDDLHARGVALQQRGIVRAEPQRVAIGAQGANRFAANGRIEKGLRRLAGLEAIQALLAGRPDGAVARRRWCSRCDGVFAETAGVFEFAEAPAFEAIDALAARADPPDDPTHLPRWS